MHFSPKNWEPTEKNMASHKSRDPEETMCDKRAARVSYLRTTDQQTVNYYSTIHALELIFFNSNTQ